MKQGSLIAAAILSLSLGSCLGIDAQASIAADGSMQVAIAYTVSAAADELGRLGANQAYLAIPVGRDDLALAASRAGGELRSWKRGDKPDGTAGSEAFVVNAELAFPSPAAFASFLDPAGERASFASSGGVSTLSIRLSDGIAPADTDVADFVRVAFSDYVVALRLRTPSPPASASGFALSGREASFSMKAADLFASPEPVSLSLSWR